MPATLFGMLRYYLRHRRGTVTLLGALLLASTGAQALTPLIVRHVIDSAMTGAALADLVWWGAAYGGAACESAGKVTPGRRSKRPPSLVSRLPRTTGRVFSQARLPYPPLHE